MENNNFKNVMLVSKQFEKVKKIAIIEIPKQMLLLETKIKNNADVSECMNHQNWEDGTISLYEYSIAGNCDDSYYMLKLTEEGKVIFRNDKTDSYYRQEVDVNEVMRHIKPKELEILYSMLDIFIGKVDNAKKLTDFII